MKCELPDGTGEMPLRLHADKSNTGFFGSDTEDSQSSGSSDEFPSLSSLLARNDRRDKRSSTIHTSVGSPIQDLRGVDSGDEDIYSGLPSPKCLPVSEKDSRDSNAIRSNDFAANESTQVHQPNRTKK